MKTCPKCGNKYRPDVAVCPNDGTPLSTAPPPAKAGPPTSDHAPPPTTGPAPSPAPSTGRGPSPAPKTKPSSAPSDWSTGQATIRETTTAKSWIFALVVSLALVGAFVVARDRIIGTPEAGMTSETNGEPVAEKRKKKRRKRRGKRRAQPRNGEEQNYEDYDWEQDFVEDDLVLGDVTQNRESDYFEYEEEYVEPEPYEPTREEYQPDGSYRPNASYAEPGAKSNVVELDLRSGSSSAPLDESQVNAVLNERRLAPCYDQWVQKIPQMKGRVWMSFVVAPDGHVAAVEVTRSQLRSRVVERCLVKKARTFRFPASAGGQRTKFDTHFDFTNR